MRSTLANSMHKRDQQRSVHTSALPVVLDQHTDIRRVVADVEIAEAHALLANPRNIGISTSGGRQNLLRVENAVRHAVKPTIERRWRAAPEHAEQSLGIGMLEHAARKGAGLVFRFWFLILVGVIVGLSGPAHLANSCW